MLWTVLSSVSAPMKPKRAVRRKECRFARLGFEVDQCQASLLHKQHKQHKRETKQRYPVEGGQCSVVSCGSERDELGRRVCDYGGFPYTGWLVRAGAFGLGVCLDDVSLSDAMRT